MKDCNHARRNSNGTCPECSKIKMAIATPNRIIYWYSYTRHNKRPTHVIISGMVRRVQANPIFKQASKIMFYDNATNELIETLS